MGISQLHANEIVATPDLVRRLLAEQFPKWAALPLRAVASVGTDNVLYRLGDAFTVRLPRIQWATGQINKEFRWLPALAPVLPLGVPVPMARGKPTTEYPWEWGVYAWVEGQDATVAPVHALAQAAQDLAAFILTLQQQPVGLDAPAGRGLDLFVRDQLVREALQSLDATLDTSRALALWEMALHSPPWAAQPVWGHGDLIAPNLLIKDGVLTNVLDFGSLGVGDPACDLVAAWSFLDAETRPIFRAALAVDEATWLRGMGWALSQALLIVPYYRHTNPGLVAVANRMIAEILAEF